MMSSLVDIDVSLPDNWPIAMITQSCNLDIYWNPRLSPPVYNNTDNHPNIALRHRFSQNFAYLHTPRSLVMTMLTSFPLRA